jgi:plasmid stabilization system protein ParE
MVEFGASAQRHVYLLRNHYEQNGRISAALNLERSLDRAVRRIAMDPGAGLPAPRPYPTLTVKGRLWIKEGRYWFRYRPAPPPPVIMGVFFETADIPRRLEE